MEKQNKQEAKSHSLTSEFIPYEQALELKELGFDENYIACYSSDGKLYSNEVWKYKDGIKAPLYQQAFRWFRNKYDKHCYVEAYTLSSGGKRYDYTILSNEGEEEWDDGETWETYEEAELACLKKLIELVKQKP
jgi:hypothetical protein